MGTSSKWRLSTPKYNHPESTRPQIQKLRCRYVRYPGRYVQLRGTVSKMTNLSPGIQLPGDLVLVHEHSDHYSLQAAKEMNLQGASNHEAQRPTLL